MASTATTVPVTVRPGGCAEPERLVGRVGWDGCGWWMVGGGWWVVAVAVCGKGEEEEELLVLMLCEGGVICCYQVTKIFCTKYGFAIASSARGPCDFGPLADLAISVFREMSMTIVFTQILTSLCESALKKLHAKNWRESLPVMEFHHPPNFP